MQETCLSGSMRGVWKRTFQQYFRTHKPPLLAAWGKNDPFFLPPGAEAFKRDIPNATVSVSQPGD